MVTKYGSLFVHFNALMIKINNQQHYITHLLPKILIHEKKVWDPTIWVNSLLEGTLALPWK